MTTIDILFITAIRLVLFFGCRLTILPILLGEARHASLDEASFATTSVELQSLPAPVSSNAQSSRGATALPKWKPSTAGALVKSVSDPDQASSHVFSLCFEEATILFALVLLEATGTISTQALRQNWTFSLFSVIALAVIFIPLGVCLLMTFRFGGGSSIMRRLVYSVPAFILWSILYLKVPLPASLAVSNTTILEAAIARTALIGIVLIALLSGSGATSAAWDTYEAFFAAKRTRSVTKADVQNAEDSFQRTCSDLAARRRSLEQLKTAPAADGQQTGMLGRWWGSSQRSKEIKSLQQEIFGLETLASAMRDDLDSIRSRRRQAVWSQTVQGRLLLGAGHVFSIYCVWRVILAALSLVILGYRDKAPPDFIALLLAHLVRTFNVEVNLDAWTRIFGLLFVGALILVRMRAVLANLSTFFRAASAGASTSFLVLFLAEVMTIYLLATLIQLRASLPPNLSGTIDTDAAPIESGPNPLLASLPSFSVAFGALFDASFLLSSLVTAMVRYFMREEQDRLSWS